jgi:RNA polymerase sigma-70 factor, ECF subfamily
MSVATMTRPGQDDRQDEVHVLVERVRAGDRDAFVGLLKRYNQRVYRIARSILADDAEAEDAAQESWVLAWRHLHQFQGPAGFASWLGRIAAREACARVRRRRLVLLDHSVEATMDEMTPDPDRAAHQADTRRLLERAVDRLPEVFRVVFVMRAVEEMSAAETATCLEIPEATVKTRLHRARRLLRDQLVHELDESSPDLFSFAGARCARITAAVLRRIDLPA